MTTFTICVKASVISSLVALSLAVAGPAFASATSDDQVPQGEMSLKGADLSSPATVKKLQYRARRVAEEICYGNRDTKDISLTSERECYTTAVQNAFAQIERKHQIALADAQATQVADQSVHSTVRTAR